MSNVQNRLVCYGLAVISLATFASSRVFAQSYAGFVALPPAEDFGSWRDLAVADFDHDGDLDCVTLRNTPGQGWFTIFRNNSRGVLVRQQDTALGGIVNEVALGDFNNDGNQDLAIPLEGTSNVAVVNSNSNGTFQTIRYFNTGVSSPDSIALADFNADGFLDIAVAGRDADRVGVLLGNGTGFSLASTFSTNGPAVNLGRGPIAIAAGDLNNDGKPDIVTGQVLFGDIGVFYGIGNGTFFTGDFAYFIDQPESVYTVDLQDVDRDGDKDIILTYGFSNAQFVWMRNRYDGGLESFPDFNDGSWTTAVGGRCVGIEKIDMDCGNDLFPDFLCSNEDDDLIRPLTNSGSGALTARANIAHMNFSPQDLAVGDLDSDGDKDFVAAGLGGYVRVYLSKCQGRNCPADLNNDGILNFFDVSAFLNAYNAHGQVADMAEPTGTWNFFDVSAYLSMYNAGCP